ncbi:MAG TPA: amino acid ABC transporter permease [Candidatus Babeliales bacterium]|nr:amino acid ABC transporter permease [Candidatus Babeliales bacterium]
MNFSALVTHYYPQFISGAALSLQIAGGAGLIGLLLGVLGGFLQTGRQWWPRLLVTTYVTVVRGIPMLIQITFMYVVVFPALKAQFGLDLPDLAIAVIAIGINSGAYLCEVVRVGIQSVPPGQVEAAQVLGLSRTQIRRYIVLPQALRVILPALGNEFITLIKDSCLASMIGVMELFKTSKQIIAQTYAALPVYVVTALVYLVLTTTIAGFVHWLERRWRSTRQR